MVPNSTLSVQKTSLDSIASDEEEASDEESGK